MFAVTGHSAQGKTLPKTCDDLLQEARRFDAIEHNTYIKHGFHDGTIVPVPDAEAECSMKHSRTGAAEFDFDNLPVKMIQKRKFSEVDVRTDDLQPVLHDNNKRFKVYHELQSRYCSAEISAGCMWSPENWSCSHDSVFMVLFHAYRRGSATWKSLWSSDNDELRTLQLFS